MTETLINRVAASGLVNINLESIYPQHETAELDIKQFLYMGMVVKEKEYRAALAAHDWPQYTGKTVLIYCSVQTILPSWAMMLPVEYCKKVGCSVYFGTLDQYVEQEYKVAIDSLEIEQYKDQKIIIKGCSGKEVPMSAYAYLTYRLVGVASSVMFGEACSNVPIYKNKSK